ncbi:hypothetical protein N0V88_007608 [Collariella sp. IMI 366227]|nr:hypothetical protein N0V88_007608 [Collariella sp. IMI 366227]
MAVWHQMTESHLPGVLRVAGEVHADLPEHETVVTERLKLFPDGCLVLVEHGKVGGYIVSFPIRHSKPPPLNALLGEIPSDADQYYLHDLALLPAVRGRGAAAEGIGKILEVAERYPTTCLTSVYGTVSFWRQYGFVPEPVDGILEEKLRTYGGDATFMTRKNKNVQVS